MIPGGTVYLPGKRFTFSLPSRKILVIFLQLYAYVLNVICVNWCFLNLLYACFDVNIAETMSGFGRVAKKLNIDVAPAMVGWDFHSGFNVPMLVFRGSLISQFF